MTAMTTTTEISMAAEAAPSPSPEAQQADAPKVNIARLPKETHDMSQCQCAPLATLPNERRLSTNGRV